MAALIESSTGEGWSAASWVFDNIMRLARKHVDESLWKLRSLMDEEKNPLRYIRLDDLSLAERAALRHALEEAHIEAKQAGSKSFASHEFYLGFIDRFRELRDLIDQSS